LNNTPDPSSEPGDGVLLATTSHSLPRPGRCAGPSAQRAAGRRRGATAGTGGGDRLWRLGRLAAERVDRPAVALDVDDRGRGAACECDDRAPAGREVLIVAGDEGCPADPDGRNAIADDEPVQEHVILHRLQEG